MVFVALCNYGVLDQLTIEISAKNIIGGNKDTREYKRESLHSNQ
jgi:hypothetical protein